MPDSMTYPLVVLGVLAIGVLLYLLIRFGCPVGLAIIRWFAERADQRHVRAKARFLATLDVTQEIPVIRDGPRDDDEARGEVCQTPDLTHLTAHLRPAPVIDPRDPGAAERSVPGERRGVRPAVPAGTLRASLAAGGGDWFTPTPLPGYLRHHP
jgi:hypothetical protein